MQFNTSEEMYVYVRDLIEAKDLFCMCNLRRTVERVYSSKIEKVFIDKLDTVKDKDDVKDLMRWARGKTNTINTSNGSRKKKVIDINTRYGIYNTVAKEFQFGICEPSKRKAIDKLFSKIGKDAYKWRFEVRKVR